MTTESSLLAQGISCGVLLGLVFLTAVAVEWPKVKAWWRDMTRPLP